MACFYYSSGRGASSISPRKGIRPRWTWGFAVARTILVCEQIEVRLLIFKVV